MRTESKDNSIWVFCLIIMSLLAAIALAEERPGRSSFRGSNRPTPPPPQAAPAQTRPADAPSRQPAPPPQPRTIERRQQPVQAPAPRPSRTEMNRPVSRPQAPVVSAPAPAQTAPRMAAAPRPVERTVQRSAFRQSAGSAPSAAVPPAPRPVEPAVQERPARPATPAAAAAEAPRPTAPPRMTVSRPITPPAPRPAPIAANTERTASAADIAPSLNRSVPERTRRESSTITTPRQRTAEPVRVTVDDIQTQPQRIATEPMESRRREISRRLSPDRPAETLSTAENRRPEEAERSGRHGDNGRRDGRRGPSAEASSTLTTTTSFERDSNRSSFRGSGPSRDSQAVSVYSDRRSPSRRHTSSHRESSSQIVINGNNNVIVQGNVTAAHPRPYIPPRRVTNITYFRTSPYWVSYGSGFVFHWSSLSCGRVAAVPFYDCYGLTYYYPAYHRKYVFVSLGGYWPSHRYVRYYWYGAHPYYWYGPNVIPAAATYATYNTYNTYNTYTTAPSASVGATTYSVGGAYQFDAAREDFSDVRRRLEAEQKTAVDAPEYETAADLCFDRAVTLFEAGKYEDAVKQFREALRLSPEDTVMPFTYAQALFAMGDYAQAASVLREAMSDVPADEPTVYYPRGLYADEAALRAQITALEQATAAAEPFNADHQLLLGYQYLGIGELKSAAELIRLSARSEANREAAGKLLDLTAKLEQAKD